MGINKPREVFFMFKQEKVEKIINVIGVLFVVTALGLAVYMFLMKPEEKNKATMNIEGSAQKKIEKLSNKKQVTTLNFETKYNDSGHVIIVKEEKNENKVFKNSSQVEEEYSGYAVTKFSNRAVDLYKEVFGVSPQHYILKDSNGLITVYYKQPPKDSKDGIKETTQIAIKTLGLQEQEQLHKGIDVYSDNELFQKLEELGS